MRHICCIWWISPAVCIWKRCTNKRCSYRCGRFNSRNFNLYN